MNKLLKKLMHNAFLVHWEEMTRDHPIIWVEIEVTRRCQLQCLHCGSSCSIDSPYAEELDMDTILKVFTRVKQAYPDKKIKVAITGGEALVRKDIFKLMARISEMGFPMSLVTNGMAVDEEKAKYLAAAGVTGVSVSVDGLKDNHNWLRNNPNSFDKAIEALKIFQDSGYFYVEPITTVNKRNLVELEALDELFIGMKLPSWRLGKTFPIGRANDYPELFLDAKELRTMLDFVKARHRDKKRPMKVTFCEEGYLGNDYEMEVRDYFFRCPAGVTVLTILGDGSITGCAAASMEYIQGNIKTDDVVDVWENRFEVFRKRDWMKKGKCAECKVYDYCRGDGFHFWAKDEFVAPVCDYRMITETKK